MATNNASGAVTLEAGKIITMLDILKPDVRQKFMRSRGDQGQSAFTLLEGMGYARPVTQSVTKTYEEDWIHQVIRLGSGLSSLGSNNYSFTLSTTAGILDYLEQNTTTPYDSQNQYVFPVKKWDIITLPENNVKFQVTNVAISGSTCTVTVKHTNPSKSFTSGNYVAGVTLIITGNGFAEGSEQDNGIVNKPIVDYHYTQIIKSTYKWTGSQAVSQPWFTEYSDGTGIPAYYIVGQENTDYEHMLSIDCALWFGALTEVSLTDSDAEYAPIQTTEGLDPYIARTGNNIPFVPGTFSVTTFDYMDKLLEQEGSSNYMAWMAGTSFDNEKDNVLKAYFQHTDQNYMRDNATRDIFGKNPGMAMEVNFKYLHKGYRTWCFGRVPQFNMKKLWGAPGYKMDNLSLIYPMGTKADRSNPSNRIPYFGTIYRELNGYNRKSEVFVLKGQGGGGGYVTSRDVNKLCMRSDIGAEHCGGNQMARLYVA